MNGRRREDPAVALFLGVIAAALVTAAVLVVTNGGSV